MAKKSGKLDELQKASENMLAELTGVGSDRKLPVPKNRRNGGLPCGPECHDAANIFAQRWKRFKEDRLYPGHGDFNYKGPNLLMATSGSIGLFVGLLLLLCSPYGDGALLGASVSISIWAGIPLLIALIGRVVIRHSIKVSVTKHHANDDPIDLTHAAYLRQFSLAIDEAAKDLLGEGSPIRRIQQTLDGRLKQADKTRNRLCRGLTDERYPGRSDSVRPAANSMDRLMGRIKVQQDRAERHVHEIEGVIVGYRRAVEDMSPVLADRLAIYAAKGLEADADRELTESAANLDAALAVARQRIAELGRQKDFYLSKAVAAVHAASGTENDEQLGTMLDMAMRDLSVPAAALASAVVSVVSDDTASPAISEAVKG